ncbi:hypothetical protein ACFL0Z_02435 [Patescibacteria group bacterium]
MERRTKKILQILGIVIIALIIAGVIFLVWTNYQAKKRSQKPRYTAELPGGTDYTNLGPTQIMAALKQVDEKYPELTQEIPVTSDLGDEQEIPALLQQEQTQAATRTEPLPPIIQDVILTQDGKDIPNGQSLGEPDLEISPSLFSDVSGTDEAATVTDSADATDTSEETAADTDSSSSRSSGEEATNDSSTESREADSSLQPPELEDVAVGTIFASETKWRGTDLGGVAGANNKCWSEAEEHEIAGQWAALLSSSSSDMKNTAPDTVYKTTDGAIVANSKEDLFDGNIQYPVLDPNGNPCGTASDCQVWTGSDARASGGHSENTCNDWTSTSQTVYGTTGMMFGINNNRFLYDQDQVNCQEPQRLYCVRTDPNITREGAGPTIYYVGFYGDIYGNQYDSAEVRDGLTTIKNEVEKIYPRLVESLGLPYDASNRRIYIGYPGAQGNYYLPQYDTLFLNSTDRYTIAMGLADAFYGERAPLVPETWKYGMMQGTVESLGYGYLLPWDVYEYAIMYDLFNSDKFPILGTNINYPFDVLPASPKFLRLKLASTAMNTAKAYDSNLFANLNQKLYSIPLNSPAWENDAPLFAEVADVFPNIEGESPEQWYAKQYLLHQKQFSYDIYYYTLGFVFTKPGSASWNVQLYESSYNSASKQSGFVAAVNTPKKITIRDEIDNIVYEQDHTTDSSGLIKINARDLGLYSKSRYSLQVGTGYNSREFQLTWLAGSDWSGDITDYGIVNYFGWGSIDIVMPYGNSDIPVINDIPVENGVFFLKFPDNLTTWNWPMKLTVKDYTGKTALVKEVVNTARFSYLLVDSPEDIYPVGDTGSRGAPAESPPAPTPTVSPSLTPTTTPTPTPTSTPIPTSECDTISTSNWLTYEGGEYTILYPPTWFAEASEPAGGSEEISWFATFGPKDLAPLVSIGGFPQDLSILKQTLESEGYTVKSENTATVAGTQATKLTLETPASYDEYLYYIPLGNIPIVIKGPGESPAFDECEPQIFEVMLENFEYFGMGPRV